MQIWIQTKLITSLLIGMSLCFPSVAQQINNPKHIPNKLANKVTAVRLKALVLEAEVNSEIDDQFRDFGLNELNLQNGECSVEIGNTQAINSFTNIDRDVVVVGDVINVCR